MSKSCADLIAQSYAATYGLPVAITRCGNFYGPGDLNWNRIVPGTIRSVLRGERPVIRSDGQHVRDYFYVEDGAAAYLLLAEKLAADPALRGEAFNFSNETQVTVLELVREVARPDGFAADAGRAERGEQRDPAPEPVGREGPRAARLAAAVHARRGAAEDDPVVLRTSCDEEGRVNHAPPPAARAERLRSCRCCRSAARRWRTRCASEADLAGPEPTFPLELAFCPACSLVQFRESVLLEGELFWREHCLLSVVRHECSAT